MRKAVAARFFVSVAGAAVAGLALGAHHAAAATTQHSVVSASSLTPGWECIPATAGQAVLSGGTGATPSCAAGSTAVLAPTFISSGVGGKPTAAFSAVNLQVLSGTGSTSTVNGEGNLVVGYAENTTGHTRTGSNNLVVGSENGWTSYGALIGGYSNLAQGKFGTVVGSNNTGHGGWTFVAGQHNQAKGSYSSVVGGSANIANGVKSSVLGGDANAPTANCQAVPAAPGTC